MKKIVLLSIILFVWQLNIFGQTVIADPSGTNLETSGANVAASGGITYSYTNTSWPSSCIGWGFTKSNSALGCVDGAVSGPPTGGGCSCSSYPFTSSQSKSGNVAYLYRTNTRVRYYNGSTYTTGNVNSRLKITATTSGGTAINFVESDSKYWIPVTGDFKIKVEMELYGPSGAVWGGTNNYQGQWKSALDIYDNLATDPTYNICSNFDFTPTTFYSIPSSTTTPTITSPNPCGGTVSSSGFTFTWSGNCTIHPNSRYESSFNGGAWTNHGSGTSRAVTLSVGANTFRVRYRDGCSGTYYTSSLCTIYYAPPNSCTTVNHYGNDWTISSNTTVSGNHTNIGNFTINSGVTAWVDANCHYFYVEAENITVNGNINGNERGYAGGNGGNGGSCDPSVCDNASGGGYGGIGGSGTGGGFNGSAGGPGEYDYCDDFWDYNNAQAGAGGGGGGGAASYGGLGASGGDGETGWGSNEYGSWFGSLFGGDCNPEVDGGSAGSGGAAGSTYGNNSTEDIEIGSGAGGGAGSGGNRTSFDGQTSGASGQSGSAGEPGGAAVKLIATGNVTIIGDITCNGGDGGDGDLVANTYDEDVNGSYGEDDCYSFDGGGTGGGGGASGGGVMIKGVNVTIGSSSDITAKGGNGGDGGRDGTCGDFTYCYYGDGGGGGGGGRIKIFSCNLTNNGTLDVSGGTGGYGGGGGSTGRSYAPSGSAGTTYFVPYTPPTASPNFSQNPICSGSSTLLSANASASGAASITNYIWSSGISGNNASGNVSAAGTYTVTVTDSNGCTGSGTSPALALNTPPTAPTGVSGETTICNGFSTNVTLTATGGVSGTGSSYQWYAGGCGSGSSLGSGSSITVSPTSTTTYYVRRVGTSPCNSTVTGCASGTITVNTAPTAPTGISGTSTICAGQTTTLTATGGSEGSGCTYQWGTGSTVGSNIIAGATSSSYTTPALGSNTTYWVRRVGSAPCSNTTGGVTRLITVNTAPTAPTGISGTSTICAGQTTTLTATGGSEGSGCTYQWGTGSTVGSNIIAGATSSSYTTPALGSNTTYWVRRVGSAPCSNTTGGVTRLITVNTAPTAPTGISGTSTICAGQTTTLTATGGSEGSGCTYQWGTGSTVGSNIIAGATSSSYTTPALGSNTTYWVRRVGSAPCSNTTGGVTRLITVNPNLPVSVSIAATDNPICYGLTNTFTATPVNGGATPSYQWQLNGSNVGTNSSTYTNSTLTNGNTITCILTSSESCATGNPATSNTINMTVNTPPTIMLSAGDYVWAGNVSNAWENPQNWLVYSGTSFAVATVIPNNTKDVFLRDYSPCASNIATTSVSSTVNCKNITIETGLNLGVNSELAVYGNWSNYGVFNCGTGEINFAGNVQQTVISGGYPFYDISLNNSQNGNSDIVLSDNLTVTHNAIFNNGILSTNPNKIIFTTTATSTPGTTTSFVDGIVEKTDCSSTLGFTFPTGDVNSRDIGSGTQTYKIWAPFTAEPASTTTVNVQYLFSNDGLNQWWYHDWTHEAPLTHTSSREYWIVNSSGVSLKVTLFWKDNNPCSIHDFCEPGPVFNSEDLTVAYWDNIWKDAGGTATTNYENGSITSLIDIPFGAKGERQITFGAKDTEMPLPVDLVKFSAECDDNSALISWETASETNNDYFILEKSQDTDSWYEFARIDGAGNSNTLLSYSVTDNELFAGDNYYRLKQVDFDGRSRTYNYISINCDKSSSGLPSLMAYPNPFTNELNVVIENLQESEFVLELYDNIGKLIFSQEYSTKESSFHTILDLNNLLPAVYNLRSRSENNVLNVKVVKK